MDPQAPLPCPACFRAAQAQSPYRDVPHRQSILLEPVRWEGSVEVLRCDRCGRVFLSGEQLRAIQDLRENQFDDGDRMRALQRPRESPPHPAEPHACPGCSEELLVTTYKSTPIPIEVCLGCGGTLVLEDDLRNIEVLWELKGG